MDFNLISSNIEFKNIKNISSEDILRILKIRNQKQIRSKMFNQKLISLIDHKKWFNKIKKNKTEHFYGIYYKKIICGGLGVKNINLIRKEGDWAFYISKEFNFPGLGACIEYKSINYLFKKYKFSKINCYVLKNNQSVLNLHKKFFFSKLTIKDNNLKNYNIKVSKYNIVKLYLESNKWFSVFEKINKKYKFNEKKN